MKKGFKILVSLLCIISFSFGLFFSYVGKYYRVDEDLLQKYDSLNVDIEVFDSYITYGNRNSKKGIMFYPGAKVEYKAYEPLMKTLAKQGFFCILIEMPYNLAILDIYAADGLVDKYTKIDDWYMMGHSLGGSMAGIYLKDNYKEFDGVILLGSYILEDLTYTDLYVISIYGSEDKILNKEVYESAKVNYPNSFDEMLIQGGNHSGFAVYGVQRGDGVATITGEQQIRQTGVILSKLLLED